MGDGTNNNLGNLSDADNASEKLSEGKKHNEDANQSLQCEVCEAISRFHLYVLINRGSRKLEGRQG